MKKEKNILFAIMFMICLVMAGCGKKNQEHLWGGQEGRNIDVDIVFQWNASHSPMLEQYEGATIDDGKIYAYRYIDGGVDISVFATDTVEQIKIYEIPDAMEIKSISVDASKKICLFGSTEKSNALWQVSPNGDISIIENIEVEDLGLFPNLKNFYADSNGYYYIWYEMSVPCAEVYENGEEDIYTALDRIYVKDGQMNTIIYEEVPDSYNNQLLSMAFDENGIPMLLAKDEEGCYVRRMRTTDREKYDASRLEASGLMNQGADNIIAYTEEGLMYIWEGALYLYHLSDFCSEKLLELATVGILEDDIIYMGMNGDIIEIIDNYKGSGQSEYTAIAEGESSKNQLTLGVMSLQSDMRKIISAFNRYQNDVTIEPIIYVNDGDYNAGYERLALDIIQGKAPDLISVYGLGYENLEKAGAFSDLYMFMQEDTEFKKEDFVSSILHLYEMDGHLYTIAPIFRIYTMWGAGSTIKGRNGVNAEELMQILRSNGGDINSIDGFSADESVLTTLCALNMDTFIDWSAGTCDFVGEAFRQVLEFAKEYKGKAYESMYESIRNGEIIATIGIINSVEDYRLASELYGESVQFVGYPTESGIGSAALFSGDQMAISSKSKYQKEAWEFVKYFMDNGYTGTGFPVGREQFETYLNESLNEVIISENDEVSKFAKRSYTERDGLSIQVYKCEPEDVEVIRDLVNNISDKFQYHLEIQNIIGEEASAYLHNQKEIEEVCGIIQNRVQLYLNEK